MKINMENDKNDILNNIGYTELVYGRINKKLKIDLSNAEIEELILKIIAETTEDEFEKIGKNIYITNHDKGVRLTINSFTKRIITADQVKKQSNNRKIN